jgi:thioesterase domain-containing protein
VLVAWYAIKELQSNLRRLLGKSRPTVILDESGVPIAWEVIKRLYDNIMKTYQPPQTSLRGVLFRAGHENEVIDGILGEDNGWDGVFGGGLKVVPITGNHLSMIRSNEHKKTLAEAVKESLKELRQNSAMIATVVFCFA